MAYQALYQKYRPRRFADVLGQAPIATTLQAAIAGGKVGHAYLFTGSRGTGKTTTARLLAMGLNCRKPQDGEPDGTCEICVEITKGALVDVLEIDAASNRGIDEIRELRDKVHFSPTTGSRKVYIIDEVHMLTKEAFNALLKTLEEPPTHAAFILATTEPHKVPQTIISRCQRFDFKPATTALLAEHLLTIAGQEKIKLVPEAASSVAAAARGSFRDALSILDVAFAGQKEAITDEHVRNLLGLADTTVVAEIERSLVAHDRKKTLELMAAAARQGVDPEILRTGLISYLRTILLARGGAEAGETPARLAADWELSTLASAIRTLVEAGDMPVDHLPELALELAIIDILSEDRKPPVNAAASITSSLATKHHPSPPTSTSPKSAESAKPPASKTVEPKQETPAEPPKKVQPTPDQVQAPEPEKAAPPSDAVGLWEELLRRTKQHYSLSVCLQKTRPLELSDHDFKLAVQSDFFHKKLMDPKSKSTVEDACAEILGRKVSLHISTDSTPERDVFDDALAVFEGAKVE